MEDRDAAVAAAMAAADEIGDDPISSSGEESAPQPPVKKRRVRITQKKKANRGGAAAVAPSGSDDDAPESTPPKAKKSSSETQKHSTRKRLRRGTGRPNPPVEEAPENKEVDAAPGEEVRPGQEAPARGVDGAAGGSRPSSSSSSSSDSHAGPSEKDVDSSPSDEEGSGAEDATGATKPRKRKSQKKRSRAKQRAGDEEEAASAGGGGSDAGKSPSYFEEVLKRISGGRRPTMQAGDESEETRSFIDDLLRRMAEAADADSDANRKGKPALAKLRILPEVRQHVQRQHLHDLFLDNPQNPTVNVLSVFRVWLEPLPDGAPPNVTVRRAVLELLDGLTVDNEHLRESGIGKAVVSVAKIRDDAKDVRELAQKVLRRWSRQVFELSADPRDAQPDTVEDESDRFKQQKRAAAGRSVDGAGAARHGLGLSSPSSAPAGASGQAAPRLHAAIPLPSRMEFRVQPRSSLSDAPRAAGPSASQNKIERTLQSLRSPNARARKINRAERVSLQGSGLNR